MKVQELIEILENMDPEATVLLATQPAWPFETTVAGVAVREDFTESDDDEDEDELESAPDDGCGEPRTHATDVLLLEGQQLRYGKKAAWEAARR